MGREQDTVARLGGDEFLIMLTQVKDTPDAAVAAERLMDAMTAEFIIRGQPLNIGMPVIGISIFPSTVQTAKPSSRTPMRQCTAQRNLTK